MVSFKGRLVIITISKNKRAISKREETKMDITQPPGHGYRSEICLWLAKKSFISILSL